MTGLRRIEGITVNEETKSIAGITVDDKNWDAFMRTLSQYIQNEMCAFSNNQVTLTRKGKLHADAIAVGFFMEPP